LKNDWWSKILITVNYLYPFALGVLLLLTYLIFGSGTLDDHDTESSNRGSEKRKPYVHSNYASILKSFGSRETIWGQLSSRSISK
jgi:hypothetical protein